MNDEIKTPQVPTKVRRIYDLLMGVRGNLGRVYVLARNIDERLLGENPTTDEEGKPQPELGFLDGVIAALCEFSSDLNEIAGRLGKIEAQLKD